MLVSVVLRLRPDRLVAGELAGRVEDVTTGVAVPFEGRAQLVTVLQRLAGTDTSEGGGGRGAAAAPGVPGPRRDHTVVDLTAPAVMPSDPARTAG